MKKTVVIRTAFALAATLFSSAHASETLFTISGKPVAVEEFEYIYKKNNINNNADFSRKSLEDYLNLFINYKLKVQQAEDLGLDTIPDLLNEYKGYEQQLFDAYIQRKVIEPLIRQEYERSLSDMGVSHIFIGKNSPKAKEQITEAFKKLKAGEKFEDIAAQYSEDKNSSPNGGRLGYFTAMQIGYPQIEDAVYNTAVGQYSDIIETDLGYHLIKVWDKRNARGRIKVSMIKKNIPESPDGAARAKAAIDSIYKEVLEGGNFGDLAVKYSDDPQSSMKAGELDWFGINTYIPAFEDAAFALKKDGEVSQPVQTPTAWYLIKRQMATSVQPFEEAEPVIRTRLMRTRMYNEKIKDFNDELKAATGFTENAKNVEGFKTKVAQYVDKYPFVFQKVASPQPLLTISSLTYNENQVGTVLEKIYNKVTGKLGLERAGALYDEAVQTLLMDAYKASLVDSVFEFSSLLEEYKNGVLIFELTRNKIWNKATTDSTGLEQYFKAHRDQYTWNRRAEGVKLLIKDPAFAEQVAKLAKKNKLNTVEDWQKYLEENQIQDVKVEKLLVEDKVSPEAAAISWNTGVSRPEKTNEQYVIYQVTKVTPPAKKELSECRGFVVAAYQEYLDKQWIAELRKNYSVSVNNEVLQKLVKD